MNTTTCPCPQIDMVQGMMDCLYAECTPCITECVMAELEKLGQHYRVALKVAKVGRAWLDRFRSVPEFADLPVVRHSRAPCLISCSL